MKYYIRYGGLYLCLVLGINLAFDFSWTTFGNFWYVACIVCLPAIVVWAIVKLTPRKAFNPNGKIFRPKKGENKFFEKLKVKKWKAVVPEAGFIGGFPKDHIYKPHSSEYMKRYLIEGCISETIHVLSIVWGITALLIIPRELVLKMGVPLVIFNFMVHVFFAIIQRYMRPRLLKTLTLVEKISKKKEQENNTIEDNKQKEQTTEIAEVQQNKME